MSDQIQYWSDMTTHEDHHAWRECVREHLYYIQCDRTIAVTIDSLICTLVSVYCVTDDH